MGILRRLREWREDSTGTLIGPNIDAESVDAGSVNTGSATINDQPAENPQKLVSYRSVEADTISETVSGLDTSRDVYHVIEVIEYADFESGVNNPLILETGAGADGNYTYTLEAENLTASQSTGQNNLHLFEPTTSTDRDYHHGKWDMHIGNSRFTIFGRGAASRRGGGRSLAKGRVDDNHGFPPDTYEITLSTSSSDGSVMLLNFAIWAVQSRSQI